MLILNLNPKIPALITGHNPKILGKKNEPQNTCMYFISIDKEIFT